MSTAWSTTPGWPPTGASSTSDCAQELLRRIGRQAGDTVEVRLAEGSAPAPEPEVSEPPELGVALADDQAARTAYAALPPEHQREFWAWIAAADDPETRADRVARTVRRLSRPG